MTASLSGNKTVSPKGFEAVTKRTRGIEPDPYVSRPLRMYRAQGPAALAKPLDRTVLNMTGLKTTSALGRPRPDHRRTVMPGSDAVLTMLASDM